jgi:hypothetical protein
MTYLNRHPDIYAFVAIVLIVLTLVFFAPDAHAAPQATTPDVECVPWGETGYWTITRCFDWNSDEVCFMASSGFLVCRFD